VTSVFVTHDQEEALEVADRVAVMNEGCIEQVGTPEHVYEHPANPYVYNFLGSVNLFHGRMHDGRLHIDGSEQPGQVAAVAYVRPHDLEITRSPRPGALTACVRHINAAGAVVRVLLEVPGKADAVEAELTREQYRQLALMPGETVHLVLRNACIFGGGEYAI
jgi:sulfate transport system ATP-binding protein